MPHACWPVDHAFTLGARPTGSVTSADPDRRRVRVASPKVETPVTHTVAARHGARDTDAAASATCSGSTPAPRRHARSTCPRGPRVGRRPDWPPRATSGGERGGTERVSVRSEGRSRRGSVEKAGVCWCARRGRRRLLGGCFVCSSRVTFPSCAREQSVGLRSQNREALSARLTHPTLTPWRPLVVSRSRPCIPVAHCRRRGCPRRCYKCRRVLRRSGGTGVVGQ